MKFSIFLFGEGCDDDHEHLLFVRPRGFCLVRFHLGRGLGVGHGVDQSAGSLAASSLVMFLGFSGGLVGGS